MLPSSVPLTKEFVVMYINWYILHLEQQYFSSFRLTFEAWNDLQTNRNNFYTNSIYTCNESAILNLEIFAADLPRFKNMISNWNIKIPETFAQRGFAVFAFVSAYCLLAAFGVVSEIAGG